MQRRRIVWGAAVVALAAGLVPALTGCGAMRRSEAEDAERLLASAGFKRLPADTTERANALQAMRPLRLQRVSRDGRTVYVYPDPYNCNCLWVGSAKAMQEYQRLRLNERQIAEDQEAIEADENVAMMHLEPWGPSAFSMGIEE